MILCLERVKLGKVPDLYFLSFRAKNGIKNHKIVEAALRRTNLLFPPINRIVPRHHKDWNETLMAEIRRQREQEQKLSRGRGFSL